MHPFLNCPGHASWPKINAASAFPVFELKVTAPNHAKNNHARFGVFPLKKKPEPVRSDLETETYLRFCHLHQNSERSCCAICASMTRSTPIAVNWDPASIHPLATFTSSAINPLGIAMVSRR